MASQPGETNLDSRYWDPKHETMTLPQLRAYQLGRIQTLLSWAYERSPYYQRSFDAAGVRPAEIDSLDAYAARVPFLTKEEVIERQQADPPWGQFLAVPESDLARIWIAPGPIHMPFTQEDFEESTETAAIGMRAAGIRSSDIADVSPNYHWVIAGTWIDHAFRKLGCAVVPGGIGNTKMHVEAMQKLKITTIFAFPTFLVNIAEVAREMGLDLRRDLALRVSFIAGELKPKEAIAEIEAMYGLTVREIYGTADTGWISFECDAKSGMHLHHHHFVEILDPITHEPVREGEGGEVVVTVFDRRAMPIIRLSTGDVVSYVTYGACSCGRHTPRLGPIVGRVGNIPRVKGMFVVPKQIENALYPFHGLGRFQMVIDRPRVGDELTLRVEATPGVDQIATKADLTRALRDAIRIGAEIEFVPLGALPEGTPLVVDNRKV